MIGRAGRFTTTLACAAAMSFTSAGDPVADEFHFAYDVLPILARAGCSAADCHGGATGRGGFKLSLFGSDPHADHLAITVDNDGRRIDLLAPERSLLLRKPTKALDHGGGVRLVANGSDYRKLVEWIRDGAPFQGARPPRLAGLRLDRDGDRVRSIARFTNSTGSSVEQDVTDRTTFSSTNPQVTGVLKDGSLWRDTDAEGGSTWILARYAHLSASTRIIVPFAVVDAATAHTAADHVVDTPWNEELAELGLAPAPTAPAAVIARRLYIDLVGRIPTPTELQRFVDLPSTSRIATTAEELCDTPDFATVFGDHLARWFEVKPLHEEAERNRDRNRRLRAELTSAVLEGGSWLDLADRLLASNHPIVQRFADPRDRSEFVGRTFLGIRIGCARCHDHPLDRWRRPQHLGFSALFTDRRPAADHGMVAGTLFDPESGAAVKPELLPFTSAVPPDGTANAKVRWFVREGAREQVARNVVNRVFALFVGRGFVEPVDDHRPSNPARHGAVLDALARDFMANGHDLRTLILRLVTSRVYQLSSAAEGATRRDIRHFARREARPIDEASFHRSLASALGVTLAQPAAPAASPLAGTLRVLNSDMLTGALTRGGTTVDAIADLVPTPEARVGELYRLILNREPSADEREGLVTMLSSRNDDRAACRDLAIALFSSREFSSLR